MQKAMAVYSCLKHQLMTIGANAACSQQSYLQKSLLSYVGG